MDVKALAQRASEIAGLPAEWILAQWQHETGNFTSELVADNNFGGLKNTFGGYMTFPTPEDFADYFGRYLKLYRPDGIYNAVTVEQYVGALKNGGYFEDSYDNYLKGVKSFIAKNQASGISPTIETTSKPFDFKTLLSDLQKRINSPLSFEKTIPQAQQVSKNAVENVKEFVVKGFKVVGQVFVGLALMVLGFYLITKDNTVIMQKEGE